MSKKERERKKEELSLIRELITNAMAEIFLLIHSTGDFKREQFAR